MTAFLGTFVTVKTMADGTPRVTFDLQCTLAEFAALGTTPGTPFGLARITPEAAKADAQAETTKSEPKAKMGPLCSWAVMRCQEPEFQEWMHQMTGRAYSGGTAEEEARRAILAVCQIDSRKDLDCFAEAARLFRQRVMEPWSRSPLNPHRSN